MLGGSCIRCGYGANFAALEFHHSMGRKRFELDMRSLSNRSWAVILREARKCELCCARIATPKRTVPTWLSIEFTSF